jgi:hypothetical protein
MPGPAPREDGAPPEVPTVEATELDSLEEDKGDEWYRDRIRVVCFSCQPSIFFLLRCIFLTSMFSRRIVRRSEKFHF